jgi:hypothetical protein
MANRNYHVVPNSAVGWALRRAGFEAGHVAACHAG